MVNITPAATPVPEAVLAKAAEERENIRRRHGVRPVEGDEIGEILKYLKGGVYGFTYSPNILDAGLFPGATYQSFEVHKLGDNSIKVIGFVTPEMAKKIETATSLIELEYYPEPYSKGTELVVLQMEQIKNAKPPAREEGNLVRAFLNPA